MAEEKNAIDQAVEQAIELLVFAPVGLALVAREELPRWVAKGRERVTGQLVLAKMFGQFAVQQGQHEARKRAEQMIQQAADMAERVTTRPAPATPAAATRPVAEPAEEGRDEPRVEGLVEHAGGAPAGTNGREHASLTHAAPAPVAGSVADLAIPGYDTLSAPHVVQRLAGLSPVELAAVGAYEAGTRGRRTILAKVAQLQAGTSPPAGGSAGPAAQAD